MADDERNGKPTVYLSGELTKPCLLVDVPERKTKIARPVICQEGEDYEVLAEGKLAERFAGLRVGTPVMVAGELISRRWKTAGSVEHQRLEIVATRVIP